MQTPSRPIHSTTTLPDPRDIADDHVRLTASDILTIRSFSRLLDLVEIYAWEVSYGDADHAQFAADQMIVDHSTWWVG